MRRLFVSVAPFTPPIMRHQQSLVPSPFVENRNVNVVCVSVCVGACKGTDLCVSNHLHSNISQRLNVTSGNV